MTSLSLARVHAILKKHLKVRKKNARWITHLLTDEQKKMRVTMAKKTSQNVPKTGLKYVRLLHDNAPAHKARIVTEFLESEKVTLLPHPPYSPDLAPCDYFLCPKLKYHLSGRRYNSRNALGSAVYQCLVGVPIEEYEKCFQKWIDRLKRCVLAGGEYFEG